MYFLTNFFAFAFAFFVVELGMFVSFPSSEHLYQALKWKPGSETWCEVVDAPSPKLAREASFRAWKAGKRWQSGFDRDEAMRVTLKAKFDALRVFNAEKFGSFLKLKGLKLVEASHLDSYWGCGDDGKGKNRLGELLEELLRGYDD